MRILLVWLVNTVSLIAVAYLMPSISVASFWTALVAALILGLVNAVIRPILIVLTLPATILTLGLFIFVINGLLFWLVRSFLQDFVVARCRWGLVGAIVYSIFSWLLDALAVRREPHARQTVEAAPRRPPAPRGGRR